MWWGQRLEQGWKVGLTVSSGFLLGVEGGGATGSLNFTFNIYALSAFANCVIF